MTGPGPVVYDRTAELSLEQSRRAWCLALALEAFNGRGVAWQNIIGVAEWLYRGELP